MRRGGSKAALLIERSLHILIDGLQRAKEAHEAVVDGGRVLQRLPEIARSELALQRDDGGAHGPIFMCTLRPDHLFLFIHPDGKSHAKPLLRSMMDLPL